jgi:hypothetical protein
MKKVPLKNFGEEVLLDDEVFTFLQNDEQLSALDFLSSLRLHSSGCIVFQKTRKQEQGKYNTTTIYLHRLICDKFLADQKVGDKTLAGHKSGNKLDCRLENLHWRSRSTASRMRKTHNATGYIGVYGENNRFRSVISFDGKPVHLGMYSTADQAAEAYNKKSIELFGPQARLNEIRKR